MRLNGLMSIVSQKIGKRRNVANVQTRGMARREALINAAIDLLSKQSPQEISFREIAKAADVPEGSAYHFYANKYDLFAAVAEVMSDLFYEAHMEPISDQEVETWHDLVDVIVDRGAGIYRTNVVARELLIGTTTPPEIKLVDQQNDMKIALVMADRFQEHFILPDNPEFETKLFYYIEMMDALFAISHRESGDISENIIEEAKRVGKGYLSTYLPPVLSKAAMQNT